MGGDGVLYDLRVGGDEYEYEPEQRSVGVLVAEAVVDPLAFTLLDDEIRATQLSEVSGRSRRCHVEHRSDLTHGQPVVTQHRENPKPRRMAQGLGRESQAGDRCIGGHVISGNSETSATRNQPKWRLWRANPPEVRHMIRFGRRNPAAVVRGLISLPSVRFARAGRAGLRVIVRQHLDGRVTISRQPAVPLTYTVVTREPVPVTLPRSLRRRRRKTGLGRWPKPEVQFASLFPKRTDHMSNG